jgi:hypothetical protein
MSRFFDLPVPSLVFLAKFVSALFTGGGVNAGSPVSRPSDLFVKEVVDIQA